MSTLTNMPAASIPSATPTTMHRTTSNGSSASSAATAVQPPPPQQPTVGRLRLPTPPRSPGLMPLGKQLTLIEPPITKGIRFLILDCPTDSTLPFYLAELKRNNVTDVVRCCEPTYSAETLLAESIVVHDWAFRDGAVPPTNIIKNWLQLVDSRIVRRLHQQRSGSPPASDEGEDIQVPTIAVHCVAGLGRAPILVAIAMVELGMANLDTVEFIRSHRRGCFNSHQIQYIDGYKRGKILKNALGAGPSGSSGNGSNGGLTGGSMKSGLSRMFRLKA